MKYCPITYELTKANEDYCARGLKLLSPKLKKLQPLTFSADELRQEAVARMGKMSIQGVQTKLSAKLNVQGGIFELVNQHGTYILKPQSQFYPELPENEALSMTMAQLIGIEVPLHGLLYSKDKSMTYFIKRFDRISKKRKLAIEDFSQLSELNRDTKYNSSMEKISKIISQYCTFPKIEFVKLFKRILFYHW